MEEADGEGEACAPGSGDGCKRLCSPLVEEGGRSLLPFGLPPRGRRAVAGE